MRNLAQYPPNAQEAVQTLVRVKQHIIKDLNPGDLAAFYLEKVVGFINEDQNKFQQFLEKEGYK